MIRSGSHAAAGRSGRCCQSPRRKDVLAGNLMSKAGIPAAVDDLAASLPADDGGEAEQAALFDELDADAAAMSGAATWNGRRRRGRAKATQDVVAYIRRTGRDPLIALADVVAMTPSEVRAHFGLDADEAAGLWRKCVEALAPYLHARAPVQVDVSAGAGFAPVTLNIGIAAAAADVVGQAVADDRRSAIREDKTKEKQTLTVDAQERVAWLGGRTEGASD